MHTRGPGSRRSPTRLQRAVAQGEAGLRLDAVVGSWLAHELARPLSKAAVRKIIMAGGVRLDGRPVRRPGLVLQAGARLDARVDADRLAPTTEPADLGERALTILFEDDDLIAVEKPAGLVMHATADPGRQDLFNTLRQLLAARVRPAQGAGTGDFPYLGLHHRLDVQTSGVVLLTKRERANAHLAAQFERGEVTKVYHAIACRPRGRARLPATWQVDDRLAMAGRGRNARMQRAPTGGARAVTEFEMLEEVGAAVLVEARPETGRKHQIRAHLSGAGMPILGDGRYGGPARLGRCAASRVMLHAVRLSLRHPITGDPLDVTCPYPPDFTALLRCLRGRTPGRLKSG